MARTLSYSEKSKGWVSFKSFDKENGISLNNSYYTFSGGKMYQHHINETRNEFYSIQYDSSVDVLLNKGPGSIKSFSTLNYEGSQARITPDINNNPDYYDNFPKDGWYIKEMLSNAQEVGVLEFWDKEDKWFSQIKGVKTEWLNDGTAGNIDPREFSYQGIGNAETALCPECPPVTTWDCVVVGGECECQQVNGGYGEFSTEVECLCSTGCCGQTPVSYSCTSAREIGGGMCEDPGDGSGQYSTYCDCVLDSECCGEGVAYTYDCQNISPPSFYTFGCMDDGITTDPFIIQQRPIGWIGEATNYSASFNVHSCSCSYVTAQTWDCIEGICVEDFYGNGQWDDFSDCDQNCGDPDPDPCDPPQNIGVQFDITDPTILPGTGTSTSTSTNYTLNNPTVGNPLGNWFRYGFGVSPPTPLNNSIPNWAWYVETNGVGAGVTQDCLGTGGGWAGLVSGGDDFGSNNQFASHQPVGNAPSFYAGSNPTGANPLTLYFHKDTFDQMGSFPASYDTTTNWNALIASLNTNGAGNVYLYQNFFHPTQQINMSYSFVNQAETCYAIQSISYDTISETYTVMVDWLVGQASFQDTNSFVWSETGPFTTTGDDGPCDNTANDGSVSIMVTNQNSTAIIPFTTWTLQLYDSTTTGSPSPNNLIYTDPNVYAVGAWSNTYVGLSVTPAGSTAYGIYYAVITDNNGCIYGPFVIRVNCIPEPDPCENYPGDNGCCGKCPNYMPSSNPCYSFCQQWGDCCDGGGATEGWDCIGDCASVPGGVYGVSCGCIDHYGPFGLTVGDPIYVAGGQYSNFNDCFADCGNMAGMEWECIEGDCFDIGIGNGSYNSESDCIAGCVDDPGNLDCDDLLYGFEACADWTVLQAGNSQYTTAQLVQHWYDIFIGGGYINIATGTVLVPLTLASLQALLEDCCGPSTPTSWDCTSNWYSSGCLDVGLGNGPYSSQASCLAACGSTSAWECVNGTCVWGMNYGLVSYPSQAACMQSPGCGGTTTITPHSCEFLNFPGGGYMYDQAAGTLSVIYNLSHNNTGSYSTQYAWQPGDTVYWQVMSNPNGAPGDMGSGFANQAPNPSPQSPDGTGIITVTGLPTTPGIGFEFRLGHYGNTNNPNTMICSFPLNL